MKKKTLSALSGAYVIATAALTGCAPQETTPLERPDAPEVSESPLSFASPSATLSESPLATLSPRATAEGDSLSGAYADGSYSATGEYTSPAGPEEVGVELAINDGVVTAVTVTPRSSHAVSSKLQGQLATGIGDLVIGKPLESIEAFAVVNGASLSPEGFQVALEKIKEEAMQGQS